MRAPRFDHGPGAALANQALEFRKLVADVRNLRGFEGVRTWEWACDEILRRLDKYEREARGAMRRPGDPKEKR